MLRLVLDTDVVVAALRSPSGASRALVIAALDGRFTIPVSVPLFLEYEAVLTRRPHLLAAGLNELEVIGVLNGLANIFEPVTMHFRWRPMMRDPDDDMVMETALNGRADALVTFNRRDYLEGARLFGIEPILPFEALRRLG